MREATGNALLTMMMVSIVAVIMIFFVGSLSYSKSFKIKNYIVNKIEENGGYSPELQNEIEVYMKDAGYNVKRNVNNCKDGAKYGNKNCKLVSENSQYEYCVYLCNNGADGKGNTSDVNNKYYKVITWMKFDFPVIGQAVKFEVNGETKTFNYFNKLG